MATSIKRRPDARREKLRDEYYRLTAKERGDEREGAYVKRRLREQLRKNVVLVVTVFVILIVLFSLVPWRL